MASIRCLNGSEHGLVVYGCLNGSERLLVQHGLVVYGLVRVYMDA